MVRQVADTNCNLQQIGAEIKDRHRELIKIRRQQVLLI